MEPEDDPVFVECLERLDKAIDTDNEDELCSCVVTVWTGLKYPESRYGTDRWVKAFENAKTSIVPTRADEPLTLYRGSAVECKVGMAWTSNRESACGFAKRWLNSFDYSTGRQKPDSTWIYTATVEPFGVLYEADIQLPGVHRPSEHEVIVDPQFLRNVAPLTEVFPDA
jgi:hypothetical protein